MNNARRLKLDPAEPEYGSLYNQGDYFSLCATPADKDEFSEAMFCTPTMLVHNVWWKFPIHWGGLKFNNE